MGLLSFFKTKLKNKETMSKHLVLIGTVKSRKQFDICFSERFYHAPFSLLIPDKFKNKSELYNIKYVAMYQSVNLYNNKAGINYLGVVESFSIVRRNEITQIPKDSKQLYVLFKISQWYPLNEPIKVSEIGIYPLLIVPFGDFKASRSTAELDLKTPEERSLFRSLCKLSTDVNMKSFEYGDYIFLDENDNLIVLHNDQCLLQLPMEVIREIPKSGFEAVMLSMQE